MKQIGCGVYAKLEAWKTRHFMALELA